MGQLTISMAIFNSYVKLPEGNRCLNNLKYQPRFFFVLEFKYLKETTWIKWVYTSNFFVSCVAKAWDTCDEDLRWSFFNALTLGCLDGAVGK